MKWLLLLSFSFFSISIFSSDLPDFQVRDQRGRKLNSKNLKGKTSMFLGCGFRDIVLCRKHGRKIYWRMQNLIDESKDEIEFVAFIDLRNAPEMVYSYIQENESKNYESVFFDETGILSSGIKPNFSWLRIFSGNKKLIYESYYQTLDDSTVDKLYEIIRKQRK
ncbi:hypothetical protein JWG45_06475 [Leptospira sp. 201903070]|uniref:Alkyl hydroperoxide reductase subunit C/ Thiol specific antioxidant domain-containing protein n=2 Tax=Leptospira ainlahdjerensis TaxID=2810033 RepID=A0ABS2UC32_9LEPT|nr:hypothetical protein [Leptospira ainlahdjerensis]